MEETKNKRTADTNREKSKKRNAQEKKTKSDTSAFSSGSSVTDPSLESIVVVGKGCGFGKSRLHDSGYRLHECYSETAINAMSESSKNFRDIIQGEGLQQVASNSSFLSAKSDCSDTLQKKIHDLEDALGRQNSVINYLKKQLGQAKLVEFNSVSTETDLDSGDQKLKSKLKDVEKKISSKDKKIKDLNQKLEECSKARDLHLSENKSLVHQVNLLNRQLQSMFELLGKKNWSSIDPTEFAKYKNRAAELEALVSTQEQENKELLRRIESISSELESKESELNAKARDLVNYKNRSTLEMCKLINQIDGLQLEAKTQSQLLDSKISEAQNSMDEEIVKITQKLEEQYQKDVKSAIEKFHADFERLADLPKTAIEKLLLLCEPDKVDFISYQKEWDKQQAALEAKIETLQLNHHKDIMQLKDNYESKIVFLKTQVEALLSQLKERKDIIDIFENELMVYKSNSSMNLLKASTLGDDISALKELYTAEIFSQKQVHQLQMNIFEEKVKTLTEEILYHAKNEEIHMQELENAKKMALAFREKYEQLVFEWEERVEKDFKIPSHEMEINPELNSMIKEFTNLIQSLKKSEEVHEERIKNLVTQSEDEKFFLLKEIEDFKTKLQDLKKFQTTQTRLDETIQDLIKTVGENYTKTIEALLMSHVTELSFKQMEMCASEKRHIAEIDALKNDHEKELEELRNKVEYLEDAKMLAESELISLKKVNPCDKLEALKRETEDITLKFMKSEGMIAIKEETEQALNERIRELEEILRLKEENCQKELEDLMAKYIKVKVLSSAKDELAAELEDKLNESEALLEKSCKEVDRLTEICSQLKNENHLDEAGDFKTSVEEFEKVKIIGQSLKTELTETLERMEVLERSNQSSGDFFGALKMDLKTSLEKNEFLEKEKSEILNENKKLKNDISNLQGEIAEKETILAEIKLENQELTELRKKLEVLEAEKAEILLKITSADEGKEEVLKRNEVLEDVITDLNERIDILVGELANANVSNEQEVFSVSLEKVQFLYEEHHEIPATSTVACQVDLSGNRTLWKTNQELQEENESLRLELRNQSLAAFDKELMSKYKSVQEELSAVISERDELLVILENLKKEKKTDIEELENLREENYVIRARCEAKMKLLAEKGASLNETGVAEMNKEIGRLTEYIKTLSTKLDVMKTNNELLISESHEHFKHNQNLVNELEEAWSQRYEIEDQLTKVRRENALLNLHRRQLEETNKRISNLVAEGKPSVVSWIKIHETVENIVDEVLALKTSFGDSGSVSGTSTGFDLPKTNSELKLVTETLHDQLKNKTMLCDELIVQKETLKQELRNLEMVMQENETRVLCQASPEEPRKKISKLHCRQPVQCSSEQRQPLGHGLKLDEAKSSSSSHFLALSKLKKNFEDQVELEEAHFRESLKLEIKELKKEMSTLEEGSNELLPSGNGSECFKSIELRYEEEMAELSKEFEREVEKLKEAFCSEKEDEKSKDNYEKEIDNLKIYFEKKWADLRNRYAEIYSTQKRLNSGSIAELNDIFDQLYSILEEDVREEEKKFKITNFLKNALQRRDAELILLREKYKEAATTLETKHVSEVQQLQSVVCQLKQTIMLALNKKDNENNEELLGELVKKQEDLIDGIRAQYEAKIEEEKKKLCDLLEDASQKHEREILALEEFWTEKLSECETKCAIMKAAGGEKANSKECEDKFKSSGIEPTKTDQSHLEEKANEERQIVLYREENQDFDSGNFIEETSPRENLCISCLADQSLLKKMELKTDDDKLDVIHQKDTLEEMISSMRNIIAKLLPIVSQHKPSDLNTTNFDVDNTMYQSIQIDLNRTSLNSSVSSNSILLAMDLSKLFQEIKDHSLLNSSDQVRFELETCLKQIAKDASSLLALSSPENAGQNLNELMKKIEREKNELELKVIKVEEMQNEMKKEINATKDRLLQWERNLEVVSEGYGEEIVEPKQIISVSDLKEKLKVFLTENCGHSTQDINLLEEISKEGDRLQEEWMKEKCDLQQQIDVAGKQLHSLKKFIEEQAVEREQEREAFDREISELKENLKTKERDNSLQSRTNREVGCHSLMAEQSVEALASQVKELQARLTETEKNKTSVEAEFQNAVKKIWSLREVIQDLEVQLAEVSEKENNLKKKVEKLEGVIEEQSRANQHLKEELEGYRNENELKNSEHIKSLEEELIGLRLIADQVSPDSLNQVKANLRQIEAVLIKKTKDLDQLHVSSANVSCSSPSEDVSIRDHFDATRCSTPEEMCSNVQPFTVLSLMEEVDRIHEKLARHTRAEEVAMKYIQDLKMQLRNHRKAFDEVQTERDVLLEKVDVYLKENSSLKIRLEEQRCNAGLLQKQLNANLESQISRLEVDVEKLNGMCHEKDKQLRDMKVLLENTTKSLKIKETEALNKSKEESALITTLKTDLANALSEKEKLEDKLEITREKLRETLKMPSLIDSIIDEKNAEIDRLEKEVARLSTEMSTFRANSTEEKQKKKIRFSEPDSFSGNISSISVHCLSDLRNCSENSCGDLRNSSFKPRQLIENSTKLESVSSIAPLQLSPRGADYSFNWKASSPLFPSGAPNRISFPEITRTSPSKSNSQQTEEISKLQEELELKGKEIESKQREISELHLEIDILKRQLVEVNQEVATAKSQMKEIQNDITMKEEEIRKLRNNEESLLERIISLKKNHAEEVEELHNKLSFEQRKVEKVYEEIKALEVKKIEIEESFLSLKEDYNEKIKGERKTAEVLLHRIKMLEAKNGESEIKLENLEKELDNRVKESEKTARALCKEISDLKAENAKIRLVSSQKANAETQVEADACVCQSLTLEVPKTEGGTALFKENLDELKSEFEKMAALIAEKDFNKTKAFSYAVAVKRLLSAFLKKVDELSKEVEAQMKKIMECSVDDLAVKVQKELVLSARLDHQLLSSIEANGFVSKEATPQPDSFDVTENCFIEEGKGDGTFVIPKPLENTAMLKVAALYKDITKRMADLEKERENLIEKVSEQQRLIKVLEESLKEEKERIVEERERCLGDAKIMELLRVNLEKGLRDLKTKDKELKKEKQERMALEKEFENYKKEGATGWESRKIVELNALLESQKEKVMSMVKLLEEEKKKNQELKLSLEEGRIEKMAESNAQRLMEADLTLLREQKENFKKELLVARKLLHSRNMEIGLLKRKINLQEIDIKALSLSSDIHLQNQSETSSLTSHTDSLVDLVLSSDMPPSWIFKMKKLNARRGKENTEMGGTVLYVGEETEKTSDIIRKLEENHEAKQTDETLIPDLEVERKLWALEKGRLIMDLETLKKENEVLRLDLVNTFHHNEALKLENTIIKKSPKKEETKLVETGFLQECVSNLTHKYRRTESHRKALAWQKQYLLIALAAYQRSDDEALKKVKRKKEAKRKGQKSYGRFRVVAIAIVAICRMKFIVKRWLRSTLSNQLNSLTNQIFSQTDSQPCRVIRAVYKEIKAPQPRDSQRKKRVKEKKKKTVLAAPLQPVLNTYNEPVNPLAYQTQHIFRQSSSHVLRTPPSRDPGPRNFSLDSKTVPDRLEKFDFSKKTSAY